MQRKGAISSARGRANPRRKTPRRVPGAALRGAVVVRRASVEGVSCRVAPTHGTCVSDDEGCSAVFSRRGSIRRRVGFLPSGPPARVRAAIVARRSSSGSKSTAKRGFSRGSHSRAAAWATMHLESPVSGSDRHSMVYLRANDGSAARPRGRGGRGRCFRWARAHDRSCGRSRTRTSRRDVQRRGKPERCIDRLGERGETLATESTFEPEPRWRNREIRAHSSRVELARSPRRAKRRKAHRTEPCHVVARESLQRIARGQTSPR